MLVRSICLLFSMALFFMLSAHIQYGYAQQTSIEILPGMVLPMDNDLQAAGCVQIKSYSADKFPQVPGPETTVILYRCGDRQFAIYQFANLNTYAVAAKARNNMIEACVDEDSLGYCTRVVQEDEEFSINFPAYDVKTVKFTAYGVEVLEKPQLNGLKIPKKPTDFTGEVN